MAQQWLQEEIDAVKFDENGLVTVVVQDADQFDVLMVAYMDAEALRRTLQTGKTCFWSRSRQDYWVKGQTSGNIQSVVDVRYDCDSDALLVLVRQHGVACHTGDRSCFSRSFGEGLRQKPLSSFAVSRVVPDALHPPFSLPGSSAGATS